MPPGDYPPVSLCHNPHLSLFPFPLYNANAWTGKLNTIPRSSWGTHLAGGLGGALSTPFNRFLLALEHKDYLTLWTANLCAGAAAWALIAARAVLANEYTELYLWVGIVTFAAMIPRVFSTVITGFLADRFNRQTVLQWTYTLNLAHNILLALLVMLGLANIWWLVVLSLLNGTLRSAQMTTTQSLVPNLVPRDVLPNAIALNEATQQGSRFLGGMVGFLVAQYFGNEPVFWACAVLYALGLVQVARIATRSTGQMDARRGFFGNLVAGFAYVYRRPRLLSMILIVLGHCSLTMSFESVLPVISQEKLGIDQDGGTQLLIMGVGLGAMFTAIWLAGVRSDKNPRLAVPDFWPQQWFGANYPGLVLQRLALPGRYRHYGHESGRLYDHHSHRHPVHR